MSRPRAALTSLILAVLAGACGSSAPSAVPSRSCSVTVWYRPTSPESNVQIVSSWNGWAVPGTPMVTQPGGWRAASATGLTPGTVEYFIVDDGADVLDPTVPTTAFHDGQEVTLATVPDCTVPATEVAYVSAGASGSATIEASFLAAEQGDALDPSTIALTAAHGSVLPAHVSATGVASTGAVHIELSGLPPGKATLAVQAKDVKGRAAQAALATVWTEPTPFSWQDAVIYEVMVDRYRAQDGSPLAAPASMAGRAGGQVGGVLAAVESGELQALGVNTLWLTPLYANPPGWWPGLDGNAYTSYHGYWPSAPRSIEPLLGADSDVQALLSAAHARGMRVLFDVVPHHVHTEHPYWVENSTAGWFQDTSGDCVCGVGSCTWATDETACWFTSYLPTLDWTSDAVASTVSADVLWWLDTFDGDGVRIDAVPMMPRAAIRRIVAGARAEYDNPSNRTFMLGENFTGQDDWSSLAYYLGPSYGLDSEFHFPLMWALRGALGDGSESMADVDAAVNTGQQTWAGSGAVMSLILDNADTSRFITVAAGQDDGDTWVPAPQPTDPNVYAREQVALGALFSLPGAPTLYYGDEIGLAGKSDPDSRRVMPADATVGALQQETRALVQTLGKARACSEALRRGTYRTLHVDPERLVYARELPGADTVVVDLERDPTAPLSAALPGIAGGSWVDIVSGRSQSLSSELTTLAAEPFSVALYVPASSACSPGAP